MNASYFIKKFKAIPDEKWAVGHLETEDGKHCAMGHCGVKNNKGLTLEAKELEKILGAVAKAEDPEFDLRREPSGAIIAHANDDDQEAFNTLVLPPESPRLRILYLLEKAKDLGL